MSKENKIVHQEKSDRDREEYYMQYQLVKPKEKRKKKTPTSIVKPNELVLPTSNTSKKTK